MAFRQLVRDFIEKEVPHCPQWEKAGRIVFKQMGALGMPIPEEDGGVGIGDYRY